MSQEQFDVEIMQELYTQEQLQQLDNEQYLGCIYCGEPKGSSFSCCGENHFEMMMEE